MVDGVPPGTFHTSAAGGLIVVGVEMSAAGDTATTYQLRFGDADTGPRKFRYKPYSKAWFLPPVVRWAFA